MSKNMKRFSEINGKRFLQEAFHVQQELFGKKLELAAHSITHPGKQGDVTENHFVDLLRQYLPDRYSIDSAIIINCEGKTSQQIDVVIYDHQYTPTLLDQKAHKYVPAEAVYAVIEVKPLFDKTYLNYAADKAASVRKLKRTSIPIPHAGGMYPAKPVIDIIAGLVTAKMSWKDGFGSIFKKAYKDITGDRIINFGLAADGYSFDSFDKDGDLTIGRKENALIFSLFRILGKLQSLGTVPAIDWSAYAENYSLTI